MNRQHVPDNSSLEPTVRALNQLSPQSQETIATLVRQLAQREGVNVPLAQAPGLQTPIEGVPMWLAKLRAERYSGRTIHMYRYLALKYLEKDPTPTKLGIQSYLAERLERVSPAVVSNERKALAVASAAVSIILIWIIYTRSDCNDVKGFIPAFLLILMTTLLGRR